jgi:hypothetical protein
MLSQPFPGPLPFWDPSWSPLGTLPGPPHNCDPCGALTTALGTVIGVWQGVAMDYLKFHPGPFQGWPACRAGILRPFSTSLDTPRRAPMVTVVTRSCLDRNAKL